MLQRTKTFHHTRTFLISVIASSLAACSTGTESTTSPTDTEIPPISSASSSSPQATGLPDDVIIPGVKDAAEINFKPASPNFSSGFFDAINNSSASKIEVAKGTPLVARGWAILADEGRPPDNVIITYGNNNALVAVAPVNSERPDVVKVLKNPAYRNSGWSVTFNPSTLPADQSVLKAWAYNSARKEATELKGTREVVVLE